ncbi:MAG: carbohydrate kinase family protein [Anaerolineaceae bacterium]
MSIVCTGSVAFDYLMTFPGYFKDHILPENIECLSLSFLVNSLSRYRGGIAPNIAYTLALLGDKPKIFATVGEDFEEYRVWLEKHGVDTRYAKVVPGVFTASFFASTDLSNSQIANFYPGAMEYARDFSLSELEGDKPDLVVISPNDPEAMNRYVTECGEMGIPYLYDPSQQIVRMSGEDIRRGVEGAYSLFVNEYEFGLLQKHTGLSKEDILQHVNFLVVTLGKKGSMIYAEGREIFVPVMPVEAIVDPTGVGDAFRGGFLRGYNLNLDWETCGKMGSLAAAYCLEQKGTQSHFYTPEQFVARYRESFDDQGVLDVLLP